MESWLAMNAYLLAAQELARTPAAANNEALQDTICRKYGIFLDCMSDDEIAYLEMLIESYC